MTTTVDSLYSILTEVASNACQGAAYENWTDKFSREEVASVWKNKDSNFRKARDTFTVKDLRTIDEKDLLNLGFRRWEDNFYLLPLWVVNYISVGEVLTSINGNTAVTGDDVIDFDVRYGVIAYGFKKS